MVAVVCVDAQLVDDLESVFAPVLDVDQGVIERRAVLPSEAVALAKSAGGSENIRGGDFFEKALEFAFCEFDTVQSFEFLAEVLLQQIAVGNVLAVGVFEIAQFFDQGLFDSLFSH
jgi:hypothetical protein